MLAPESFRTCEGVYTGQWEIAFHEYSGPDFSRRCFLFSGQGAAFPGMFRDAYQTLEPFQRRFEQADRIAAAEGLPPVSAFIVRPEAVQKRDFSVIRNLALVTAQCALFDHLAAHRITPLVVTGSSLGEFPALACAGVIEFEEMLAIVLARDRSCPPDNQAGFLIAVGADLSTIYTALDGRNYFSSNLNSPGQTAISVEPANLQSVLSKLTAAKLRHKLLDTVPQPYHSPLLEASARRFRVWLESAHLTFRPPRIPLISSITGTFLPADGLTRSGMIDMLSLQLTAPVNFIAQVNTAYAARCFSYLEAGPGETLATFARETLGRRDHKIVELAPLLPVAAARPVVAVPEQRRASLFGKLRAAISKITGYEIERISIEDRFQEDLGIDSIKKANIIFTVLDETGPPEGGYDSSSIRSLEDAVAVLSGAECSSSDSGYSLPWNAHFVPYANRWEPRDLVSIDEKQRIQCPCTVVRLSSFATSSSQFTASRRIALIADVPEADVPALARILCGLQTLISHEITEDLELTLVTDRRSATLLLGLPSFFKSLRKERSHVFFKHIHFDRMPEERDLPAIVDHENGEPDEIDVRYVEGRRWVSLFEPLRPTSESLSLTRDAVIVAFGGAKGIGRALLERLPFPGHPHLYVVGRSPGSQVEDALAAIAKNIPNVYYEQADARDAQSVRSLLSAVNRVHGRIDFVLNAAGIQKSALLETKGFEEIVDELSAKVVAAENILAASRDVTPGLVVHFSSMVAQWGNAGQTVYACANQAVNQLTRAYNDGAGRNAALAIEWPAWEGVGMTAEPAILNRLRRSGFALLNPEGASELLAADLAQPRCDVVQYQDENDLPVLQVALRDQRRHRNVIGNATSGGSFERVLDRDLDRWLSDHAIEGTPYLPAASAITMALCLGELAQPGTNALKNFRLQRAIAVRERRVTLRLDILPTAGGLEIRGRTDALCFDARIATEPLENFDPEPTPQPAKWGPRGIYGKDLLFHGPAFQVLHQIGVEPGGRFSGRVVTSKLSAIYGAERWDRATLWIDAAFQLLALEGIRRFQVQALPMEVERVYLPFHNGTAPSLELRLSAVERIDDLICGNVVAEDDQGRTILRMERARMAIIRSAAALVS